MIKVLLDIFAGVVAASSAFVGFANLLLAEYDEAFVFFMLALAGVAFLGWVQVHFRQGDLEHRVKMLEMNRTASLHQR